MPFCPKCPDEFQDWVKPCPDCQVDLVAELPDPPESVRGSGRLRRHSVGDPLVCVASALDTPTAYMWAGMLEEKGIRCLLKSFRGFGIRYKTLSPATIPEFDIYVVESDAGRAKEILEEVNPQG